MTLSSLPFRHFLRTALAVLALSGAWPTFAAFTDNGDGTVTDTTTGLMWDQCTWGLSGAGCATGGATYHTWQEALGVAVTANAINGGVGYKNHNDWRLPNVKELESLVKIDASYPAIDTTAFPNTQSDWYWSSTIYTPYPAYAWLVDFSYGVTDAVSQSSGVRVRLVRSGQSFDPFDALVNYPVTATASPVAGGTVSCSPNPVSHGGGSTCTATPNAGYSFTSWSGDCTGASCNLSNVTAAQSVTAGFALDTYAITATASPAGGGTVSCSPNPVDHGGSSTCTATPNAGYSFTSWSGDCTGASCNLSNVTAAQSVTAGFGPVTSYTAPTATATGDATLAVSGAGCVIASAQFIAAPAGSPANTSYPHGLADFTLAGCTGTATVTITYPSAIPAGAKYWKEVGGVYTEYPATIGANSVTFSLTDGGAGDSDPAPGVIHDPSGVGVTAAANGGAQPIPVFGPWGLALLSGLLGLGGAWARRRRV